MKNVEVYKTDISEQSMADVILDDIRRNLPGSDPSIDLEDCDKVLRIECTRDGIDKSKVQQIISGYGCEIEVLR